jgi:hypothetical protein
MTITNQTEEPKPLDEAAHAALDELGADEIYKSALNGHKTIAPSRPFARPIEGDLICGPIVEKGRLSPTKFSADGNEYVTIKCEAERLHGREIPHGEWVKLVLGCAALKEWAKRDRPEAGDKVSVFYAGQHRFNDGTLRHEYAAGIAERSTTGAPQW